jgi:CubicO group peptidase (beta-lactamase class C family)
MNPDRLKAIFLENFTRRSELGASVSVWVDGREALGLSGGFCDRQKTRPWTESTLALAWSATKGPAAACALHALQEHGLTPSGRVAAIWPEFAAAGKARITFGQLLSHQAGLAAMREEVSVFDHDAVAHALARQEPLWKPGDGHGYHPRTFGFLLDEIVRRLSGVPLGEYWREKFAGPLGLDFWIGLPEGRFPLVSPVHAARAMPPPGEFARAFSDPASLTFKAFASPRGLESVASMNTPEARKLAFPGFGGIGNARSLAKFYAMLARGGELDGIRFFGASALEWMGGTLASGPDRVLTVETAFSAGFMKDPTGVGDKKRRAIFGPSPGAFGHPGAGGSLAFADPEHSLAFAYVMNQMEPGVMPGEKALRLVDALDALDAPA